MYSKIQKEKKKGFSRDAAARHLKISWATVDRYWDMTIEDYESLYRRQYSSNLDNHKEIIMTWLRDFQDVSASQIQDWIQEHYQETFNDRTVRNYVCRLRNEYNIPKTINGRDFGCIPELPPGQQMQADFGVYNAIRQGLNRIKLHFVIFILAHSRYKYIVWQKRPFTSIDFVNSLESCFEAFGGIPMELVIDQDRLMTVDENYGDIIYTREFERCKILHDFTVWLCRKGDPESKGMVESGVKFVKYNFARHRIFINLQQWSNESLDWLVRTGNGKVHAETKKIPAEAFASEKACLKPVRQLIKPEPCACMITTPVRKNNTIRYRSGRYAVPLGTFRNCPSVSIRELDGHLEIYDASGKLIISPPLAASPGELVSNSNHNRDTSAKIQQLLDETKAVLGNTPQVEAYLQQIRKVRKRYIRDQLLLILSVARKYEPEIIRQSILACQNCDSDTATDFRDFAEFLFRQIALEEVGPVLPLRLLSEVQPVQIPDIQVIQHSPSIYNNLIRKGVK